MDIEDQGLACVHTHTHTHTLLLDLKGSCDHIVLKMMAGSPNPSYSTLHLIISGPYMEPSSPQAQGLSGVTRADTLPFTTPRENKCYLIHATGQTQPFSNHLFCFLLWEKVVESTWYLFWYHLIQGS